MTGDRDANKPAGPKNLPASVRARLLAKARDMGDDYQRVLNRFAMERFLYRMGTSDQRDRLVLKGANLFVAWQGALHRATKDLDLEGFGSPDVASVCEVVSQVCAQPGDDGLVFKADSIRGERIREDGLYEGVRVHVVADLGGADIPLQIDVGFGDTVVPGPEETAFPTLLPMSVPHVRAYNRYVVVAEKVEAIVALGVRNSRMKDFYDVALLAAEFAFDGPTLVRAVRATFERRETPLPQDLPFALTAAFLEDPAKRAQWAAFMRKGRPLRDLGDLAVVGERLRGFLEAPLGAARGEPFEMTWPAGGPWAPKSNAGE